ncbi:hypothetical protein Peur_005858 [Populus x canadensis]
MEDGADLANGMVAISTRVKAIPEQMWRGLSLRIEGYIKCIVDAAIFQNHAMGAGFIIRDQNGQAIWCGTLAAKGKFSFFTGRSFGCKGSSSENQPP